MPRLSLGLGVQSLRKIKSGGAAPSVIPVASTNTIIIVDTEPFIYNFTGTFTKESDTSYRNLSGYVQFLNWDGAKWSLYDDNELVSITPTPPANNINYIPTTGWPTQTLTAA